MKRILIFIISTFFFLIFNYSVYSKLAERGICNIKNIIKKSYNNVWNKGNYIDLGANSGDSILWFYNIYMSNIKYTVPYPKISYNISKNFNTYIFEANPFLCISIYKVVEYIKRKTKLVNFNIYCPVIVSTYDGVEIMAIDSDDIYSSKYYGAGGKHNSNRKNYTIPVLNITNFIIENIPYNDFNVMKFDVEGEEHFIIPDLIKNRQLNKFDILYSEFHINNVNNPAKEKGLYNYLSFINYTNNLNIETYEESKISKNQMKHYSYLLKDLISCKPNIFS